MACSYAVGDVGLNSNLPIRNAFLLGKFSPCQLQDAKIRQKPMFAGINTARAAMKNIATQKP
jgi:hypothetical protein